MFKVSKKISACAILTACATVFSANALSEQTASNNLDDKSGKWGISLGMANYSNKTISNADDLLALSGTQSNSLIEYDNSDSGYHIGINYLYSSGYSIEIGYLDQGDIYNLWEDEVASVDEFVNRVRPTLPVLGQGVYFRLGKRISISDKVFTEFNLGAFIFNQDVDSFVEIGGESLLFTQKEEGLAFSGGLAFGYQLSNSLSLKLTGERYRMKEQNIDSLGVNLSYHF